MHILRLSILKLLNFLLFSVSLFSTLHAGEYSSVAVHIPQIFQSITIDGYLNDAAWKEAAIIKDFYTYRPVDGQPAAEKTAVFLAYDESSLFVAFICFDPSPDQIRSSICKRDKIEDDDFIVLYLDTFNSGKETYSFSFNPFGIQADGIYIDMVAEDLTPDYIFYSKGRKFAQGYIVEAEIPFKSLRFPNMEEMVWGISVARTIKHLDKDIIWPAISRNSTTFVPQFAKLHGLKNINGGKNIEILPEATAFQSGNRASEYDEFIDQRFSNDLGVNLKFGFLSNLTLDMAYNPDFSQVEADADRIDVNRRFPLYYDEKRPFFLESTNIFQTPINAVYTRRIVDPFLGMKLTGNLSGYEIGLLGGIDEYYGSSEYLSEIINTRSMIDNSIDSKQFNNEYKNKNSYHTIFRLRKEMWNYSKMGILFTDKHFKDTHSMTYGIDGNLLIANEFSVSFQALNSNTKDFFADTTRNDPAFYFNLFRGSRTFNFQIYYNDVFPDFEVANGFIERESDYREGGVHFWYDFRSDDSFIFLAQPSLFINQMYDHAGNKIESYIAPSLSLSARGQNTLTFAYYRQFEEFLNTDFSKNQYLVSVGSKTLSWLFADFSFFWGDGIYYGYDPFPGSNRSLTWGLEFKPIKSWATRIDGSNYLFTGENEGLQTRIVQDIYHFRSVFQYTREISLRLILEQNNYYKDLDINVLAGWHPSPGTVIFLGYNDYIAKNSNDKYMRFARGIFFKFSYLLRL